MVFVCTLSPKRARTRIVFSSASRFSSVASTRQEADASLTEEGISRSRERQAASGRSRLFRFDQFHLAVKATIESEICRQWSDPLGKCIVYLDREQITALPQNICDLQAKGGVAPSCEPMSCSLRNTSQRIFAPSNRRKCRLCSDSAERVSVVRYQPSHGNSQFR